MSATVILPVKHCPCCRAAHDVAFTLLRDEDVARREGWSYRGRCPQSRESLVLRFGATARPKVARESARAQPREAQHD